MFVIFQCIFRNIKMTMSDTRDFTISHQNFKKQQDHQTLTNIIVSWNSTRLDLFELSLPNENLEFSGKTVNDIVLLDIYILYQESRGFTTSTDQKVSTKCVRVESIDNTARVVEILIEKFR